MNNSISAMILAAGFGRRMMPITKNIPKPLIDINGITLLGNTINFINSLGIKQIIINTHYKNDKIENFLKDNYFDSDIILSHEQEILDTGGAVKNSFQHFTNNNILLVNSDIFWRKDNYFDVKKIMINFLKDCKTRLLLVEKKNAFGIDKNIGDFFLNKGKIRRYRGGNEILYYSGLQLFNKSILSSFKKRKFSFNEIWDFLISQDDLYGEIMNSKWYHVGDLKGLYIVKKIST